MTSRVVRRKFVHSERAAGALVLAAWLAVGAACGDDDGDAADVDERDSGVAQEDAGDEASDDIPTFNGCTSAMYEDLSAEDAERTVAIAQGGLVYTPKCMTITRGQSVRWEGSLAAHPLAPGNPSLPSAGSADSPIVETSSGSSAEFTFESAGTFPYYCTIHAFGTGMGMAGSIHVR